MVVRKKRMMIFLVYGKRNLSAIMKSLQKFFVAKPPQAPKAPRQSALPSVARSALEYVLVRRTASGEKIFAGNKT